MKKLNISPEDIVSVGITNQRETTVVWDAKTGKPLHNALGMIFYKLIIHFTLVYFLVWLDMRTASTVDKILATNKKNKDFLKSLCGLPLSTYFSAVKLRWLMDNVPQVQKAIDENRCLFGTIDTWLIWVGKHLFLSIRNYKFFCRILQEALTVDYTSLMLQTLQEQC